MIYVVIKDIVLYIIMFIL